ncbi:polysaccharide ABC transporter ATP-binding protein [Polaribacter sp. Asnod1-A03]|uniref:ABC transporter ATP-binding protein n=1 Tax=Polaribacter sp. Asnod1-A03 TaxID=3160581 RepID=UPI003869D7E4
MDKKNNIILKVENLSKQYRLGTVGTGTISHDLNRFFSRIRGKEDPYLKIGESNNRGTKGNSEYVWALKDINFEIRRGEVLGIIGKNGAGKSTLLKILSKVTGPTTGSIKSKGRIASLLEVGTGFHPEMTGKENVFLNGAILGMNKKEIQSKLAEIVSFSGCERYIDTPVKRYSSGMKVRLAFAVAAHLEPDILIVDEVLAVGDAEFQKKAIGKMQSISNSEGRTVLFVSHNMAAVKSLCKRGVVLDNGESVFEGSTNDAIEFYKNNNGLNSMGSQGVFDFSNNNIGDDDVKLIEVSCSDSKGRIRCNYFHDESLTVKITLKILKKIENSRFALIVKTLSDDIVFVSSSFGVTNTGIDVGINILTVKIPSFLLNNSNYIIAVSGAIPGKKYFFETTNCLNIKVESMENKGFGFNEKWPGSVHPVLNWTLK